MRLQFGDASHEMDLPTFMAQMDMEELRSKQLVEWLQDRYGMMVSGGALDRVGFLDEVDTDNAHDVREYDISPIVFTGEKFGHVESK